MMTAATAEDREDRVRPGAARSRSARLATELADLAELAAPEVNADAPAHTPAAQRS